MNGADRRPVDLRSVLDRVSDGVFSVDPEFTYTYLNEAGARLVGRRPEDLVGRSMWTEFPDARGSVFEARYREALADQRDVAFEEYLAPQQAWFRIRVYPSADGLTIVYTDVTAERQARHALERSEELFRNLAQHANDVTFRTTLDGTIEWSSDGVATILGYTAHEVVGRNGLDFVHPDDRARSAPAGQERHGDSYGPATIRLVRKDGTVRWVEVTATEVREDGRPVALLGGWHDVTSEHDARAALMESEERYRLLAENSTDVILRTVGGVMRWVSPSLKTTLGWDPSEWIGRSIHAFTEPDDIGIAVQGRAAATDGDSVVTVLRLLAKSGEYHWVEAHLGPFTNAQGEHDGHLTTFRICDTEVAERTELERLARFDTLTGLLNRKEILHKLRGLSASGRHPGRETALLFCDIDRFKDINDAHGHAAGDEVLRTLAERIGVTVRAEDFMARIGGDELIVVLTEVHSLDDAADVAEKIRLAATVPIRLGIARIVTTLSIGVTLMRPGESVDELVTRADRAMYYAKSQGRNQVAAIPATA